MTTPQKPDDTKAGGLPKDALLLIKDDSTAALIELLRRSDGELWAAREWLNRRGYDSIYDTLVHWRPTTQQQMEGCRTELASLLEKALSR